MQIAENPDNPIRPNDDGEGTANATLSFIRRQHDMPSLHTASSGNENEADCSRENNTEDKSADKMNDELQVIAQTNLVQNICDFEPGDNSPVDIPELVVRGGHKTALYNDERENEGSSWNLLEYEADIDIAAKDEDFTEARAQGKHHRVFTPLIVVSFTKDPILCTVVYGKCDRVERTVIWDFIRSMGDQPTPWFIGGDFNSVVSVSERSNGIYPAHHSIEEFSDAIFDSGLIDTFVKHLPRSSSDHYPLLISLKLTTMTMPSSFHFQNIGIKPLLETSSISYSRRKGPFWRLKKKSDASPSDDNLIEMNCKKAEWQHALSIEEDFWRQKAACKWVLEGERNTRFYNSLVRKKQARNVISLVEQEGQKISEAVPLRASGVDFFRRLLTADRQHKHDPYLLHIPRLITPQQGFLLQQHTTFDEVKHVVFDMSVNSVVGPDGFNAFFYRTCWDIIGEDVVVAVQDFLSGFPLPTSITTTSIALIPKAKTPPTFDHCPKEKRLCPTTSNWDNIQLAQDILHLLAANKKDWNVALKLDMAKAYDRVDWNFLEIVLLALGFPDHWAVLATMPIDLISILKPPKGIMLRIERMFNKIFWGSFGTVKRLHWSSWRSICRPIEEGGLGVRLLADTMEAFSMKLWWRFHESSSLWSQFLTAKYCKRSCTITAQTHPNGSPIWRHLKSGQGMTEGSIAWAHREGNLCFWHDFWVGEAPLGDLVQPHLVSHERVHYYWADDSWDIDKLRRVLPAALVQLVSVVSFDRGAKDMPVWRGHSTGIFSISSAWNLTRIHGVRCPLLKDLWHRTILPSMSILVQRLLNNFIAIDARLREKART
ncbi:UNVERIFIED_CONTAM: hypothetical protein Slati_3506200 [Sesamum latifolium]|uniref:Reverse transcriptase domain-containing protein n=1 Tax=Sesamum latifolium TaxID=2727402 RepID=A0AAW2UHW8_9LAMI